MGWKEIGETFYRWTLLRTRWFTLCLHYLDAPNWHPQCHDHPWWFVAIILAGGYWENAYGKTRWRGPLSFLYRPAWWSHNVATPRRQPNWSLIITGPKAREWGFHDCR
jgi:hypothetical protein